MAKPIEFFYFIGSTYTYLTTQRLDARLRGEDVEMIWRPFDVRSIMIEQNNVPFRGKPVKAAYMWRDLERRARGYGLPWRQPPVYPVDAEHLAGRVAFVGMLDGWAPAFTQALYRVWFLEDRDPGDVATLQDVLHALGHDPAAIVAKAATPAVIDGYRAQTERAKSAGIFGSPTFLVGEEVFWGDDRLEDALAWARDGG